MVQQTVQRVDAFCIVLIRFVVSNLALEVFKVPLFLRPGLCRVSQCTLRGGSQLHRSIHHPTILMDTERCVPDSGQEKISKGPYEKKLIVSGQSADKSGHVIQIHAG